MRRQTSSSLGSSYYSFGVLLLMFIIAFFAYEHYTSHEEDPSLITKAWKEVKCGWNWLKGYIVKSKSPPTTPTPTSSDTPPTPPPPKPTTPPPVEVPAEETTPTTEKESEAAESEESSTKAPKTKPKKKAKKEGDKGKNNW